MASLSVFRAAEPLDAEWSCWSSPPWWDPPWKRRACAGGWSKRLNFGLWPSRAAWRTLLGRSRRLLSCPRRSSRTPSSSGCCRVWGPSGSRAPALPCPAARLASLAGRLSWPCAATGPLRRRTLGLPGLRGPGRRSLRLLCPRCSGA